jgi:tripartite-type tricarboxylate transporter receptor subunit TctC
MSARTHAHVAAALAAALASAAAVAQGYPTQAVRVLVPFTAGGGTDILARVFGQRMSEGFGQQVVVDNRPGGNTLVATEATVRAAPDGHTLLMQTNNLVVNPTLYRKLNYDTLRDLIPISLVAANPHIIVVHPSVPAKDLKEFVALAKRRPGALNFATAGSGTVNHLSAELFQQMAGIRMTHIPYKGSGSVIPDLLGGQVELMFAALPVVQQHIRSGRLRAIALTTPKRFRTVPDVPTIGELGYAGYDFSSWFGLFAPVNTPGSTIERIHAEVARVAKIAEVRDRLADYEIHATSPQEFAEFVRREIPRMGKIVRDSGATID